MTRHELNKTDRWFSQELSLTHAMVSPEPAHDLQTAVTSNPHDSISAHSINSCRVVCSVRDVLIATADRVHTQHTMPLLSTPAMRLYRRCMVTQCEALSGHLTDINNSNLINRRAVKGVTYHALFDLKGKTIKMVTKLRKY